MTTLRAEQLATLDQQQKEEANNALINKHHALELRDRLAIFFENMGYETRTKNFRVEAYNAGRPSDLLFEGHVVHIDDSGSQVYIYTHAGPGLQLDEGMKQQFVDLFKAPIDRPSFDLETNESGDISTAAIDR